MAETLGDAVLSLRTDDAQFNSGITQARGRAEQLGGVLDKTSGSSSRLAAELLQTGQSAKTMGAGFEESSRRVTQSAGAQRAGMQQLSYQLGDIATMYSLGARPMQIFASQSGQVVQAVQMMTGGTSRLAAFLGGPWGIALTSATIVLTPFIAKLFQAEDALQAVEFASDKMGDAQDILSGVLDRTTGKMITQRKEAIALARALSIEGLLQARRRRTEAEREIGDISQGSLEIQGGLGGGISLARVGNGAQDLVRAFQQGSINADQAAQRIQDRILSGQMSENEGLRTLKALTSIEVETKNEAEFQNNLDLLDGRGNLDPVGGGRPRGGGTPRSVRERQGRSQADRDADFARQELRLRQDELRARLALATGAQERADIQSELLGIERESRIAEIEASDLSRTRKDALIASVELVMGTNAKIDEQGNLILSANRGLEGQIIAREAAAETLRDSQQLLDADFDATRDALNLQLQLADTEAARKDIALKLLDAEEKYLRKRLQLIIDSEASTPFQRSVAEAELGRLESTSAIRREVVGQANATSVERYLESLRQTPAQIKEAVDAIAIDGLDRLNDGLVEAILNIRSLGDVFSAVANQIIGDLLRIAIQQEIIKPLAEKLFGGGGGGGGAGVGSVIGGIGNLLGKTFAGGFADGGLIPSGQFGIVGEAGPELAFAGPGGVNIVSNADSRQMLRADSGSGTTISMPINIDATGADAAAIARLNSQLAKMERDLPERIVTTIQEAGDRRIFSTGDWR